MKQPMAEYVKNGISVWRQNALVWILRNVKVQFDEGINPCKSCIEDSSIRNLVGISYGLYIDDGREISKNF